MSIYSHSKLSTFEQCKYKYKLQYIDKVKVESPTTVEAFMGNLVHQTLEKLYSNLKFQKKTLLSELLAFYNALWQKEWTEDILIVKKEFSSDNYRLMGEKYITDYYTHYAPFDDLTILGLETQEQLTLPDGSKYHVRIDKLGCKGNTYFVCDYKTNATLKDQEDADTDRQLAMYSIWVKKTFVDAHHVILKWHMLAFDKEITSERTSEQLAELQKEIVAVIKKIEMCTDFPTTVSKLCDYCVYKSICPAWKHEVEIEQKTPEKFKQDDGVKLVDEYSSLHAQAAEIEEKMDVLKAKLIAFAKSKEIIAVYGSNKKAKIQPYDFYSFPPKKDRVYVNQLIKENHLWDLLSELDTHKLSKALKEHKLPQDLARELETFVKKKELYRVSLMKK